MLIAIDRARWNTSRHSRTELENVIYSPEFVLKRGLDETTKIIRAENAEHEHLPSEYVKAFQDAGFSGVNWLALINPSLDTIKLSLISSVPSRLRRNTKYRYVQFWPIWIIFPTVLVMKMLKLEKFKHFIKLPREKKSNRFQLKTVFIATK